MRQLCAGRSCGSIPESDFREIWRWVCANDTADFAGENAPERQCGSKASIANAFTRAATEPVTAFCNDRVLWGELAGDARLMAAVVDAARRVDNLLQN